MENSKVSVIRGADLQGGDIPTYVGVMRANTLAKLHKIPRRDATKGKGYQRSPGNTRINHLASEISAKKVDLPTSVLLSLREPVPENFLDVDGEKGHMDLSVLDLDKGQYLYVVDGQHRILALEKVLREFEEQGKNSPNLKIPFVCMIGADESTEMKQFYVVNKNAKSVPIDLAYSLMRQRAENDPNLMKELIGSGRKWEVEADELVTKLANGTTWHGLIRLANAPKAETVVPVASFIKSLRPLLVNPSLFQELTIEQRIQLLEAYWQGIHKYYQKEGYIDGERGKYGLFKGVGVSVMNHLLPFFIERARGSGNSLFSSDTYENLVAPMLDKLEGSNSKNEPVSGMNFWQSGHAGAIGGFSSESGKKLLTERLKSLLPPARYE